MLGAASGGGDPSEDLSSARKTFVQFIKTDAADRRGKREVIVNQVNSFYTLPRVIEHKCYA